MMIGPKDMAMGFDTLQKWLQTIDAPVLAGNLLDKKTGKPLFQDTLIIKRNNRSIGFFGVVTADWKQVSSEQTELGFNVEDPIAYSQKAFEKLNGKADIIFALSSLNDGEVKNLAQAIPELKFILRCNSGIRYERKNMTYNNAVAMSGPRRGKYLNLLTLVEKNGSLDFQDVSERKLIENRLESYQKKLDQMVKREKVNDIEELKKKYEENPPKLRRMERYVKYIENNKDRLKQFPENVSYFELDRVSMDKRVGVNPEILAQVEKVKTKWGDPGKITHPFAMKSKIDQKAKTAKIAKTANLKK